MNKKSKVKKYIEIKLSGKEDLNSFDYIVFLIETMYNNLLPFFIGFTVAKSNNVIWFLLITLPIFINFKFKQDDKKTKTRKIFLK